MNWTNLGAVYGRLGRYAESVVALNRGLEIDVDSVQIRKNLAITYAEMGDYKKADEVLSKIPLDEVEGRTDIERLIKNVRKKLIENDF
jgi:Flp pilus assembly protein TadD